MKEKKPQTFDRIWYEYMKGVNFKQQLDLYETVRNNENFYVGKQWEGVNANGLPTPVFNFIKRIVLFLVASTSTDNVKMSAAPLASGGQDTETMELLCKVVNDQFEGLFEQNKIGKLIREFMRDAAVRGDACIYSWFDPDVETGQKARGAVRCELLESTRVIFGDPNQREVQEQPYILISRRERLEDVRRETEENGGEAEQITADSDEAEDRFDRMTDGKVTTVLKFWKDPATGTVWGAKATSGAMVRKPWDTKQKRYPIVWMSWEKVTGSYHGQAAVTGLIPNQVFVNKMFAMVMLSLMSTAYPKVVYDKNKISRWDNSVGKAIGVDPKGMSIKDVAATIDPAVISPQVSQFIELAIGLTKELMGATDVATGNAKPDNTSAIIAMQKASQVPMELIKLDMFQCVEDLGYIWLDLTRAYYGERLVEIPYSEEEQEAAAAAGVALPENKQVTFDFATLNEIPLSLKLDVGGSAFWSEIAQMNTLDNLLVNGQIDVIDYLERVPNGYISNQQELIDTLKNRRQAAPGQVPAGGGTPVMANAGMDPALIAGQQTLERKMLEQGAEGLMK